MAPIGENWSATPLEITCRLINVQARILPIWERAIDKYGLVRNARIRFTIKVLDAVHGFHVAVLFRKNGIRYLGAGLGGWTSDYSIFSRSEEVGFVRLAIGDGSMIQKDRSYKFDMLVKAGYITSVTLDGESIISELSIRDSLRSFLRTGHIGLYAYDRSLAEVSLKIRRLPADCFVITNLGRGIEGRRSFLTDLMQGLGVSLRFIDARDLSRDHTLMSRIRQALVHSDLVLADFGFGDPRPNVYYETGIAHSIGVPTIHITKSMRSIPSDLKSQFFVLEKELKPRLRETVKTVLSKNEAEYNYLG